jgi:hypothetical protein
MFEQQSNIRAAHERVSDLRHRAQHHAVVKAIITERRQRLAPPGWPPARCLTAHHRSRTMHVPGAGPVIVGSNATPGGPCCHA